MYKQNPLVSICMPAFNSEKYILDTLSSLLAQTYQNIEVIVVDDGSEDNTRKIVEAITDPRLTYVWQENKGAAAARNKAFHVSQGEYIKFMDADDLINESAIENQLNKIKDRDDCVASSKWGRFYLDDLKSFKYTTEEVWKDLPGIDWIVHSLLPTGINMTQPGIFLIPKNLINKVGLWNESLSLSDDFEFMTKIIVNANFILFCENSTLYYRSGISNSLSSMNSSKHLDSFILSLDLGVESILKVKNDKITRLVCANCYQVAAFNFYPENIELYNYAQKRINFLGGSTVKMQVSKKYNLLCSIFGWKNAKKIKSVLTLKNEI